MIWADLIDEEGGMGKAWPYMASVVGQSLQSQLWQRHQCTVRHVSRWRDLWVCLPWPLLPIDLIIHTAELRRVT